MWIRQADPTCLTGREKVTLNFIFPERIVHVPNTKQTQDTPVSVPCCGAVAFTTQQERARWCCFQVFPKEKQEVGFRSKVLRHCRDRAIQTHSEELRGQLTDDLHLSWESQGAQNRMENLWHFSFPYHENPLCGVTRWPMTQNHEA